MSEKITQEAFINPKGLWVKIGYSEMNFPVNKILLSEENSI